MKHHLPHIQLDIQPQDLPNIQQIVQQINQHHINTITTPPHIYHHILPIIKLNNPHINTIITIDYPKGTTYGFQKLLSNLPPTNQTQPNGYEIHLTPDTNDIEAHNELKQITEFIKTKLNPTATITITLGTHTHTYQQIQNPLKHLTKHPINLIRTDPHNNHLNATPEKHQEDIRWIQAITTTPIKISANITPQIIQTHKNNQHIKYALNTTQLQTLINHLNKEMIRK